MPLLPIEARRFGGRLASANGHTTCTSSRADLVRAAVTAGYPNLASATTPPSTHRTWAVLFRASVVLAYLQAQPGGRITRSSAYNSADRSEKGAISYYLGLFGAKLSAELVLQTPWLWHYDTYHQLAYGVGPISRRPDLIGKSTTGDWIALEAKGRTNGWAANLLTSAKAQAQTIGSISHPDGRSDFVSANVAAISWFDRDGWRILLDDPAPAGEPLTLRVPEERLAQAYYQPVLRFISSARQDETAESVEIDGAGFKAVHDPDLDVYIGVSQSVIEAEGAVLLDGDVWRPTGDGLSSAAGGRAGRRTGFTDNEDRPWSVGDDGVAVRLGERWQ